MVEMYENYKSKGLEILAVNGTGESADEIAGWLQSKGATYPGIMTNSPTNITKMLGVRAYPTNVVFDKEGKIIYRGEGFSPDAVVNALRKAGLEGI